MNTLEFTFRHNYIITKFELDVVGSNWDDVRILDRSEADKVVHGFILDCERWIAIRIVLMMDCVVKVVAEQGSTFICHNFIVVNQSFYLFCCDVNKKE